MPRRKKSPYIRIAVFALEEILSKVGTHKHGFQAVVDGAIKEVVVKMNSPRYHLFASPRPLHGPNCVKCGLKGAFFALERSKGPGNNPNKYHFNLYGITPGGHERMLTKDHIIPKALGGKNRLSNYQTMCTRCNGRKADKLDV